MALLRQASSKPLGVAAKVASKASAAEVAAKAAATAFAVCCGVSCNIVSCCIASFCVFLVLSRFVSSHGFVPSLDLLRRIVASSCFVSRFACPAS